MIANLPGLSLKTSLVRVKSIRAIDISTFEANAEIQSAFRLEKNGPQQWRVTEFRTGQDQWQGMEFVNRALRVEVGASPCDVAELTVSANATTDPSIKRARCLLAELLGVQLPADAVRIKAVSPMALPFSSKPSAMVEAVVTANFHFQKGPKGSWRVAAIQIGKRDWVDPEVIASAVNQQRVIGARAELESIARALEAFRAQRGFYVESKSEAVLIDFLSPHYLSRVIRLDPWGRPYRYEGTRDRFTLSSLGPDGKENTNDDIVVGGRPGSAANTTLAN